MQHHALTSRNHLVPPWRLGSRPSYTMPVCKELILKTDKIHPSLPKQCTSLSGVMGFPEFVRNAFFDINTAFFNAKYPGVIKTQS